MLVGLLLVMHECPFSPAGNVSALDTKIIPDNIACTEQGSFGFAVLDTKLSTGGACDTGGKQRTSSWASYRSVKLRFKEEENSHFQNLANWNFPAASH